MLDVEFVQYHLLSLSPDPMTIVDLLAISSANIVVISVQKCHYDHTSGVDDSVANGSNDVCHKNCPTFFGGNNYWDGMDQSQSFWEYSFSTDSLRLCFYKQF